MIEMINKSVIDELADIRLDALRMMRVYDDMIQKKLRELEFFNERQIMVISEHDPSSILVLTKKDDGTVTMAARPNNEHVPPGVWSDR